MADINLEPIICLQALEAAKKQLRAKEAALAEAAAEADAAAGERTKLEEQIKTSVAAVAGNPNK
jgi:hypothetical protein